MERRILRRVACAAVLMAVCGAALWYGGRMEEEKFCTEQLYAMDTVMTFTAYGKNGKEAVDAAMKEVQRLDGLLSTGSADSEISMLNETGSGTVSEDTAALFREGLEIYRRTDGAFDFTIYPLMKLWGFSTREYHVPSEEELQNILPLVDASKVAVEGDEVRLGEGQQVDFGGIAKGYASDRVMEIYREYGITSGMVSLGGNVQVLGGKPDGSAWRVGIQEPEGARGETAAVFSAEDCAVVTSGGYERYFEEAGVTYIHILDPGTGYPAEGNIASVTVISEDGTLADALSTSLYIMGFEEAVSYWRSYGDAFEMVLITSEGGLYATEGVGGQLQSDREMQVITRNGI